MFLNCRNLPRDLDFSSVCYKSIIQKISPYFFLFLLKSIETTQFNQLHDSVCIFISQYNKMQGCKLQMLKLKQFPVQSAVDMVLVRIVL